MSFLHEHDGHCSVVSPCKNCQAIKHLKINLGIDKFYEFLNLLDETEVNSVLGAVALDTQLENIPRFNNLSFRTKKYLKSSNITTVADLVKHSEVTLQRTPNLGKKAFQEIVDFLRPLGRYLGEFPSTI